MAPKKLNGRGRFPVVPSKPVNPIKQEDPVPSKPVSPIKQEEPDMVYPLISLPATDSHPSIIIRSNIPRVMLLSLSRQEYKEYIEGLVPGLEIFELSTKTRSCYISSHPPPPTQETDSSDSLSQPSTPSEMPEANPTQVELDPETSITTATATNVEEKGNLLPKLRSKSSIFRLSKIKKTFRKLSGARPPPPPPPPPPSSPSSPPPTSKPSPATPPPLPTRIPKIIPKIIIEEVPAKRPALPPYFPYTRYVPTTITSTQTPKPTKRTSQIPAPIPSSIPKGIKSRSSLLLKKKSMVKKMRPQSLPRLSIPRSPYDARPVREVGRFIPLPPSPPPSPVFYKHLLSSSCTIDSILGLYGAEDSVDVEDLKTLEMEMETDWEESPVPRQGPFDDWPVLYRGGKEKEKEGEKERSPVSRRGPLDNWYCGL